MLSCYVLTFLNFFIVLFTSLAGDSITESKLEIEKKFLERYKDQIQRKWSLVKFLRYSDREDICDNAHIQAGKGTIDLVSAVIINVNIHFRPKCDTDGIIMEALRCAPEQVKFTDHIKIQETVKPSTLRNRRVTKIDRPETDVFYLTQGIRPDCVFYLNPLDTSLTVDNTKRWKKSFSLGMHVCGLLIPP